MLCFSWQQLCVMVLIDSLTNGLLQVKGAAHAQGACGVCRQAQGTGHRDDPTTLHGLKEGGGDIINLGACGWRDDVLIAFDLFLFICITFGRREGVGENIVVNEGFN